MTRPHQDAAEIARKLTKAQRGLLTSSWPLPQNPLYGDRLHRYDPVNRQGRLSSVLAIWRRGLVENCEPDEGTGPDAWEQNQVKMGFMRLTPLGVQVRILASQAGDA